MKILAWLNDHFLDRSKRKRAERNLEDVKAESRRQIAVARRQQVGQLDLQNLWEERDHEKRLAQEWLDIILSDKLLKEVRTRPIDIPPKSHSRYWYKSNELEWILTPSGRRQLNRLLKIERRQEWHLRLQIFMAITGVLGAAIGFATVLLQCG